MRCGPLQVGEGMSIFRVCKYMDPLCKRLSETVTMRNPGQDQSGREMYFFYALPVKNIFKSNNNKR